MDKYIFNFRLEKNILKYFITIIFIFLFVSFAFPATKAELEKLAEINDDIEGSLGPVLLQSSALQLGKINSYESVELLEKIFLRCNEIQKDKSSDEIELAFNIARAYAIRSLIQLSGKFKANNKIIENNFIVSQPVGIAMSKAEYEPMFKLFKAGVSDLNSEYSGTKHSGNLSDFTKKFPETEFTTKFYSSRKGELVDDELLQGMFSAAYVMEFSKEREAFPVCKEMLKHSNSFLWEKYVYRAIARLEISEWTIYSFLKYELIKNRNKENDPCLWDLSNQNSILFSIKNISTEAYLILTMWRLKIPLKNKVYDTLPSLKSSSFTAKAAAIDCLATSPIALKAMLRYIPKMDDKTRKFLAIRLSEETNSVAQAVLGKLKN